MALTFSNISSTLAALSSAGFSGASSAEAGTFPMGSKLFFGQLNRALQGREGGAVLDAGTDIPETGLFSRLEDIMGREGGTAFLRELKSLLLSLSNGDLDNLSINAEGLDALGNMLDQAGFDPAAVEELMTEFSPALEQGEGSIPASDVVDRLFELPQDQEDPDVTEGGIILPTSDLPYIQSVLGMLGLDQGIINGIVDKASLGTLGFDLNTFIDDLRQLSETSFNSGIVYQTDIDVQAHVTLLSQLDLEYTRIAGEGFSLGQLIKAFEQKQGAVFVQTAKDTAVTGTEPITLNGPSAGAPRPVQDMLAQLFGGIEIFSGETQTVTVNPDVAGNRVRESFQSNFLNQINGTQVDAKAPGKETPHKIDPAGKNLADQGGQPRPAPGGELIQDAVNKAGLGGQASETGQFSGDQETVMVAGEKTGTISHTSSSVSVDRVKQSFAGLPDHVTRQVSKNIVRAVNLGESTLRIQLKPPELGRVFMTIDNTGDTMKVSIITEHQSAKDILAANVNEIKVILSSSGISLERFEVDMSSDFRQSMADARGQGQSGNKRSGRQFAPTDEGESQGANDIDALAGAYETSGSLHLLA